MAKYGRAEGWGVASKLLRRKVGIGKVRAQQMSSRATKHHGGIMWERVATAKNAAYMAGVIINIVAIDGANEWRIATAPFW